MKHVTAAMADIIKAAAAEPLEDGTPAEEVDFDVAQGVGDDLRTSRTDNPKEAPMSDRTRTRLLIALLVLSAVLALAGAGLATYARLKG